MKKVLTLHEELQEKINEISPLENEQGWISALSLEYDTQEKKLFVTFPHVFFEKWFSQNVRTEFENCIKEIILIKYNALVNIVYKNPVRKQSTASFFVPPSSAQSTDFFEEFIYNTKNAFPLAVLREIAQHPFEAKYNPFIMHGKTSTGKTQILQCMKKALEKNCKKHSILHVSIDDFSKSLRDLGPQKLASLFSIFIIDTFEHSKIILPLQEIFIEFLELCLHEKKQLIIASAIAPEEDKQLKPALRSRLNAGLVVQLKESDIDVRMRFAVKHCKAQGIRLSKEHILLIAQRCSTIALLRGVILKILAFQTHFTSQMLTSDIENILISSGEEEKNLTPQSIIYCIATYFDMAEEAILGDKRTPDIVRARQLSMYLCRDILGLSYAGIGKIFGGKDHSTVMYGIKKIKKLRDTNKNMQHMVTELRKKCFTL